MSIEERIDPDFDTIIEKCRKELEIKFPNYGNTWLESDDEYYKERLTNEVDEYIKSMTPDSERRKLLNIINIAAMAYQTALANRAVRQMSSKCIYCGDPVMMHMAAGDKLLCPTGEVPKK